MAGVWIDASDVTQLAQRLRVGPRELLETLGGPWHVALRADGEEIARPGTLYLGRAGPSVGLLLGDDATPVVTVGVPTGEWTGPDTVAWSVRSVVGTVRVPAPDAASSTIDDFLDRLGAAVDEAAETRAGALVLCRYCGRLVAPEYASGDECCTDCGASGLDPARRRV
jgi:hypothetical protein